MNKKGISIEEMRSLESQFDNVIKDAKESEACVIMTTGKCMIYGDEETLVNMIGTAINTISKTTPDKQRFNAAMVGIINFICSDDDEEEGEEPNDKTNVQGSCLS